MDWVNLAWALFGMAMGAIAVLSVQWTLKQKKNS